MALVPSVLRLVAGFCATSILLLAVGPAAWAGRVHPELESQLGALPPGGTISVIVEMSKQEKPAAAVAALRRVHRSVRVKAVKDALEKLAAQDQAGVRALLANEQAQGRVRQVVPFWVINGLSVTATEAVVRQLAARADVKEIRVDRTIRGPRPLQPAAGPTPATSETSEWNIDLIRAPEVWALHPDYTGVGSVVGSFDTGVDVTHPDLAPRYRGNHSISWFDPYGQHATPFDADGHGTHTTGIAVGGDASGANIGVAPGAKWIAAKAFNDFGFGSVSAFHQIFQWFLAPGGNPANAPDVVNASWAIEEAGCFTDFRADILALRAAGIFTSFAAGNDGPDDGSVRSPGAEPEAFAVGATDFVDDAAFFSGRGPSPCGGIVKPDLSAPGDLIVSTFPGNEYLIASGTSMAAPHVTGAVAVLRSIDPTATVDELTVALTAGAVDLGDSGPDNAFGAGRLDLFQSVQVLMGGAGRPVVTIAATSPTATELPLAAATFTVTRTGATDDPLTVHYTTSGTATPDSDYVALTGTVTIPAGAASETIVVTPIDDAIPEPQETVVVALSLDPAHIVGSPSSATAVILSDEIPPDLLVTALSVPNPLGNLSPFVVTDTTANQGGIVAPASTTRFYLSADDTIDASDIVLGNRLVATVVVGGASSGSTTLTLPQGTTPGTYHFIAKADADGAILENQEGNNTRILAIQVRGEILVAPGAIDLATPPATFTVTGFGFANLGFGLPIMNFTRNGVVLAQARATAMTPTTLTVPFPTSATAIAPNLPGLTAGAVDVQAYLQSGSASYQLHGNGPLAVTDSRPPPGVNAITPNTIDLATPPATFTVTGNGFASRGFGLPIANFSRNGAVLAQARATAMTSTTLTVPFPTSPTAIGGAGLPGLSAGPIVVEINDQTGPASFSVFGTTPLTVTDTRPVPGVSGITPSTIDLATPPATFTVTGNGFANRGFGLPIANFSRNGAVLAQARATAMTSTTLMVPFPTSPTAIGGAGLPGLSAGPIVVEINDQTGPASFSVFGTTPLTVTDTRPAPGVSGITPSTIDLTTPPATFTVTGYGFADLGFGLPIANFTRNGAVLAQARATAMTLTTLTVPFPTSPTAIGGAGLPGLSAGPIVVQIYHQTGPASFSLQGSTALTVTGVQTPPGVSAITPSTIDLATPPATFTVTGNGFANLGFGLPIVNFARNGVVLAQARATAMTSTTLTVPFPTSPTAIGGAGLPGLSAGAVDAQVYHQTGPATFSVLGSTPLTVTDTRPTLGVSGITPNTIDLATPPATFTVTGNGFADLGFGLPIVNFARNGVVLAQARATAMTSTTLTVPFPTSPTAIGGAGLPGLSAGAVDAQVYHQTGPVSFSMFGSAALTATGVLAPPGVNAITPNTIDLATPPAMFTVTGNGFADLGFGLPIVNFARNGVVLAQARATAMTSTTLTVPFPTSPTAIGGAGLPGLSAGAVNVQVYHQTGPATFSVLGSIPLTVTDTRPVPGVSGITPGTIDLATPPATFTVTGYGFANLGFGLPIANFSRNGAVLAQARATAMTSTTLTVPFPTSPTAIGGAGLPGLSAGPIVVEIYHQAGPASFSVLGTTPLTVTDTRPAPGVSGITPGTIDLTTPPATFSVTGGGFANLGFGLPIANFTRNGVVLAQARATAMTSTTLTVPFPTSATAIAGGLPGLSAGPIVVQIYHQTGPASYIVFGSTVLTVQ